VFFKEPSKLKEYNPFATSTEPPEKFHPFVFPSPSKSTNCVTRSSPEVLSRTPTNDKSSTFKKSLDNYIVSNERSTGKLFFTTIKLLCLLFEQAVNKMVLNNK
jgi:hypothetical protein